MPTKKKPTEKPQITAAEHLRPRLPTEKPTKDDADKAGAVMCWDTEMEMYYHFIEDKEGFPEDIVCWLPGHLPPHLIPQPETAEARMRREFEEWAKDKKLFLNLDKEGEYAQTSTFYAWLGFQEAAARKEKP